ncbi:hypothetical protein GVO57_04140 [Sphingomonas changnyeongensis]|uniref:Flagellar hook-length control protein-like C-terminal domain-containing protein n=1 Tax=Sphingomonas changnyeongensis TaxID=2698679 RepID=A0A7Z2NUX2_9SPHN|nr:flagellar hook-length control protein FliK [Sphingomonas changnyeongensis]QHL90172.1 hypothetical protein GVO57_04140 [Sphingomonas changnyeongensis]
MNSISLGPPALPSAPALPPNPTPSATAGEAGGAQGFAELIGGIELASLPAPAGQDLPGGRQDPAAGLGGRQDTAAGPGCALGDLPVLPAFVPPFPPLPGADGEMGGEGGEAGGPAARLRGRVMTLDPLALPLMLQMPGIKLPSVQPPVPPLPPPSVAALPSPLALAGDAGVPGPVSAGPSAPAAAAPVIAAQPPAPGPGGIGAVTPAAPAMAAAPAADARPGSAAAERMGGALLSGRALRAAGQAAAAPLAVLPDPARPGATGDGAVVAVADAAASPPPSAAPLQPSLPPSAPAQGPSPARPPEPPVDTARNDWMQSMIAQIAETQAEGGARAARIRLLPDALGAVDIRIVERGDGVHVELAADNPQARALLAEAQPRLHELAEARGLRLAQASIDAALSGGQSGQSGQRQPAQEPPPVRRGDADRQSASALAHAPAAARAERIA